ncbi:succinate-semialdehyde dehydrogenase / glutarate-semialdehyde dehydrogenase [Chitinophaga terrae (ex Kim and Jung 2007)]|uniref:Succinate-semialdehyde dehydrogenase / glutarate-semialdehyde dehydrogenase n=1 Tax=Chitinophaga terrae (ex Kim and Jung 2007) TaxID=408074 RepID=A0A1H4BHX8_9BACT|nr:NAD-dependent succinate-semialdehyde dehydrogenase [Chitinophaga terrae (ex Kim and Jung 2007)]GEP89560.1 succinate-semialdehyde dehydrogenase [Chitinophaga terrae (ex Kim and Jung 2007)]SEA47618.1 succinate-semialdehyde dehydrogenase / glutarate-semialdehyde dehydrogenase [Chitinophaga terrae (ex Kim and Jung 2007)]
MFTSINPFTQETIAVYTAHTPQETEQKLELGYRAYRQQLQIPLTQRREWMMQIAESLRKDVDEHAALITSEMGKPLRESRAEVLKCATTAEYYAENIESMLAPRPIKSDAYKSYVSYEPKGIILAIMPWNFPYWQVFRFAIPNILAGNTGLLKHASNVSGCALAIEKLFMESGFPEGSFQSLLVSSKDLEPVFADSRVQGVTLTGSTPAGRSVAALAGKYIKKTVLELGGSDPFIVLKDADLEAAAKTAVQGRMQNAGQSCIAAKRWIVEKEVAPAFTAEVKRIIEGLKQGDPTDEATNIGPMARLDLAEELASQLQASISEGAEVLVGGYHEGCNFAPTLLRNVTVSTTAFKEETFGPIAVIVEADNEDAAIALANETNFGLGAALWTSDLDKAARLAKQIESGNVFINAMVRSDARLPFGGIKESGYGRELSLEGTHEFLNIKTVYIQQ